VAHVGRGLPHVSDRPLPARYRSDGRRSFRSFCPLPEAAARLGIRAAARHVERVAQPTGMMSEQFHITPHIFWLPRNRRFNEFDERIAELAAEMPCLGRVLRRFFATDCMANLHRQMINLDHRILTLAGLRRECDGAGPGRIERR